MELSNANAFNADLRIKDFYGEMVALRFVQAGPDITKVFDGKSTVSKTSQVELWSFDGEEVTSHGRTLLFPEILQRDVAAAHPTALTGRIEETEQKGAKGRTTIVMQPLDAGELEAFAAAL